MRLIFTICIWLGTCVTHIQTEDTIIWNENYRLSWDNFKAKADSMSDAVALTASGITFGYSISQSSNRIVDFKTTVEAHFYPEKSWFKKLKADDYILSHEQLHFDITELHSRKFRKDISQLRISSRLKKQLDDLHAKHLKNLSEMQNKYDYETQHSIDTIKQQQWHLYIQMELEKLAYYR